MSTYFKTLSFTLLPSLCSAIGHHASLEDRLSDDQSVCRINILAILNQHTGKSESVFAGTGTLFSTDENTPPKYIITANHILLNPELPKMSQSVNITKSTVSFDGRSQHAIKSIHRHHKTDLAILELAEHVTSATPTQLSFEMPHEPLSSHAVGFGNYRPTMDHPILIEHVKQKMVGTFKLMSDDTYANDFGSQHYTSQYGPPEHFVSSHFLRSLTNHSYNSLPTPFPLNLSDGFFLSGDSGGKIANEEGKQYAVISAQKHEALKNNPNIIDHISYGLLLAPYEDWIRNIVDKA